jgi:hypothetical protein
VLPKAYKLPALLERILAIERLAGKTRLTKLLNAEFPEKPVPVLPTTLSTSNETVPFHVVFR